MEITVKAWQGEYILSDERVPGRVSVITPKGAVCGPWDALRFPGQEDSPSAYTIRYAADVAHYALEDNADDERVRALVANFLSAPKPDDMLRGAPPATWIEM